MKIYFLFFFLLKLTLIQAQSIDEALDKYLTNGVPSIQVEELSANFEEYVLLDAREFEEYQVSQIQGAIFVGYTNFQIRQVQKLKLPENQKIIVYCSIGVRSEEVAEQIQKATKYQVYNLYGGIFEWKNKAKPVVDQHKQPTEKVHGYSKKWSKYLKNAEIIY